MFAAFIKQSGGFLECLLRVFGGLLQFCQELFFAGTGSGCGGRVEFLLSFGEFGLGVRRFSLRGSLSSLSHQLTRELCGFSADLPQIFSEFPFAFLEVGIGAFVGLLQALIFSGSILDDAFGICEGIAGDFGESGLHSRVSLQFGFKFLQLLVSTAAELLIECRSLLILLGEFWRESLVFGLAQFRTGFGEFLSVFECLEVFGNGVEGFRSLFLLFGGLTEFLLAGGVFRGGLLQFLIHAFGGRLNERKAVVAVPCAFPLLFIGKILPLSVLHEGLQEILNLIIDLLLLLLKFSNLRLGFRRGLFFGSVGGLQRFFFQLPHFRRRAFRHL